MAKTMPVHRLHTPLERFKAQYAECNSWRKVAKFPEYTKPNGTQIHYRTLHRWAVEGIEPKDAIERCVLGLPALLPAPACAKCGGVHVTKRCSRAVGETMAVLMATGHAVRIPHSPLDSVRTLTANIAAELGEAAAGSPHYRVLFLTGVLLFVITFVVNLTADMAIRGLRRK